MSFKDLTRKVYWYHLLIIAAAVLFLNSYVGNFISGYLTFLKGTGIILNFVSIFLIILVVDLITETWLEV